MSALLAITMCFVLASRWSEGWLLPVLAAAILGLVLVGALQLRHDGRLSEKNFLELIKIAIMQVPTLLRRSTESESEVTPSKPAAEETHGQHP
ncbi:hypothetical protein GCM10009727_74370 [Actinomadura napierensis]|uniref:DUF4229 domain-containing protein n=1 Tax=Actinomadura napierensis TaxID=267854 RepID=A0ABN3ACT2_9ACTN